MSLLSGVGFWITAGLYLLLCILLLTAWKDRQLGNWLLGASITSVAWASGLGMQAAFSAMPIAGTFVLESVRYGTWIALLGVLLSNLGMTRNWGRVSNLLWILVLLAGLSLQGLYWAGLTSQGAGMVLIPGGLVLSITGLVLVEQLFRNTPENARWALKYLCFGLGGIFSYDLFLYAQALLLDRIDPDLWNARGYVNAILVPAIAISARRNPQWSLELFLSRQVVTYSTALIAIGAYLLAMAAGGYYLHYVGGTWGGFLQIVFSFGALLVLLALLFSDTIRSRFRVFLSKHFFRNKYDYRQEWLRFTATMAQASKGADVREVGLRAIAQIVHATSGVMWWQQQDGKTYRPVTAWMQPVPEEPGEIDASDVLIRFMAIKRWVIDVDEYRVSPEHYENIQLPAWLVNDRRSWLVVPLRLGDHLRGFVSLMEPQSRTDVNFEDRDLLQMAAGQVALQVAQFEADSRLAETGQFKAYSRLTAFMMHDLKNLVAQQSMVVANAEKHKNNPEFVQDAIDTVANSVRRMGRLIEQLQRPMNQSDATRLDLGDMLRSVVSSHSDRMPAPELKGSAATVMVSADPERLAMVFSHLIRNAQDATPDSGSILVSLGSVKGEAAVEVIDTGSGMDAAFVRERLFRPFDSTKGSKGMGIGAYQAREYVQSLGGRIHVDSQPGRGTRFCVYLPLSN